MDVILVAAKRSAVQGYSEVLESCGLVPKIVDVGSFALHRVFAHNYQVPADENVLLLNIGCASTDLLIARDGNIIHAKVFEFGGKHFTEAISNQLGLDQGEAETHKVTNTLKDAFPAEFQTVITLALKDFMRHLQSGLDFFYSHNDDTPIKKIYITGGSSKLLGFCDFIHDATSIPTEILDVFQAINYSKDVFQEKYINGVKPLSAISLGLALRLLDVK
jgi:type IV pilus assembly protein PilM